MSDNLTSLRASLAQDNLSGFILPVNDEFMGEYVPASAQRLTWLTGFTGSAGMAVVLKDKAAFFTDGRYTLQAQTQVKGFELYNSGEMSPEKWIAGQGLSNAVIGYDPKLHTRNALKRYENATGGVSWKAVSPNPVDALWHNRPAAPASKVKVHPVSYAGQDSTEKRILIAHAIAGKGADAAILTAPDSICWLLNIRGDDVPYTPFILCYAIIEKSGAVTVYLDKVRVDAEATKHLDGVTIKSPDLLSQGLQSLKGKRVLYDPAGSPVWFYQELKNAGAEIIEQSDPCQLPKACKNEVEVSGIKNAHIRDGLAETKFLCWLDDAVASGAKLTEMSVAEKLESFRKLSELYLSPSFSTISGSGANGAIVHYHATPESNRAIENNSLLLLDSGAQYADGTTDITRTIAIGTPSAEMKRNFTLVLKGHIALALATFPLGTSGSQLDGLARQYLWQEGLDYDHGTGHGVGAHLSVHEGPQRISKRGGDAPLEVGMIVSNEPGYYKAGAYGIRIENLVVVKEASVSTKTKPYLGFETITLVPMDVRLIDTSLLTKTELQWLQDYHQRVLKTHTPHLTPKELEWLKSACSI